MTRRSWWRSASPRRRVAFAVALVFGAVWVGILVSMGGFTWYLEWALISGRMPWVIVALIGVNAFDAIIIVEMVRAAVSRFESWSDRRHFRLVAILWAVLFIVTTAGAVIVRQRVSGVAV